VSGEGVFEHFNPVHIAFGRGCLDRLPGVLAGRRTLLVTGQATLERADCQHLLGPQVRRSSPVPPNPGDLDIDRLLQEGWEHRADCVVGLGGGSVLDAAKVVAMLLGNWPDIASYRARQASRPREVTLVQVPTTAGTGSEVTRWASLWNQGVKSSVDEAAGFADLALVDPRLVEGMPPRLTLATGLDAASHAMESLWGVFRTPLSEGYATRALALLSAHLEPACQGRAGATTWDALALASLLAGLALSCTRSAAAHALSYELTGRFGLEHGLAVGLLCRPLLLFNHTANPEGVGLITGALGVGSPEQAQDWIDRCFRAADLQPSLACFGVTREQFPAVIGQASASNRLGNNPGVLDSAALLGLLESIA
jgi:alcohol dehydrogenase class IV